MFYTIYAHQRKIKKYQSHKNVKCIWKHYTLHIKSMFPNFWYLLYLLAKKILIHFSVRCAAFIIFTEK